jgi:hypothetical protein
MELIKEKEYILFCNGIDSMKTLKIEVFIEYKNNERYFSDNSMKQVIYDNRWKIFEYTLENLLSLTFIQTLTEEQYA